MARTPWFLRIVACFRTLLMAEDRFYCIVDIKDILMLKKLIKDIFLMLCKLGIQFLFVCCFERTANTVLADNTSKTQQRRKNRIIAQPVDMDIPRESADDCKNSCAYDIADFLSVWTCIVEWSILDELVEEPARFQVGHKVGEPAPLGDLRFRVPAHVQFSAKCRNINGMCRRNRLR